MNPYLRIGRIVRPHGVRGAVKVMPETDDLERFRSLDGAFIEQGDRYDPVSVLDVKLQSDSAIVTLDGIDTADAASALRGKFLCVDRAHAIALPEWSFFICDLIGCETYGTDGRHLGRITDVYSTGANDVYVIDGGKLSVPALRKLLARVDLEEKRIVFDSDVLSEVGLFED